MKHSNADLLGVISPVSKQEYSEAIMLRQAQEMASKTNRRQKDLEDELKYVPNKGINLAEGNKNFANKVYAGEIVIKMFEKSRRLRRN
jgi:hypothetical protein